MVARVDQYIKHKEPGIVNLSKQYNDLCDQMVNLIDRGAAPRGAIKPKKIDKESLFKLDVDDDTCRILVWMRMS